MEIELSLELLSAFPLVRSAAVDRLLQNLPAMSVERRLMNPVPRRLPIYAERDLTRMSTAASLRRHGDGSKCVAAFVFARVSL